MNVLVTGATGFLGQALVRRLVLHKSHDVRCAIREKRDGLEGNARVHVVGEMDASTDWQGALVDVNCVVHLAARVHIVHKPAGSPHAEFHRVNNRGTLNLARQAAAAGVKRFIFISSVKVNGESTPPGRAFTVADVSSPQDAYGQSKHEAEQGLRQIASDNGMEVVLIRPPMVYGPGVKANFRSLLQLVDKGIPLPFSALESNRRSYVGVSNLIDLILLCLKHPAAANQTFYVSDNDDISTAELLRRMGKALGRSARNLPIPQTVLKTALRLVGKGDWLDKLCGDLRVDISETNRLLGWKPKLTMKEELKRTAKWWKASRQGRF